MTRRIADRIGIVVIMILVTMTRFEILVIHLTENDQIVTMIRFKNLSYPPHCDTST